MGRMAAHAADIGIMGGTFDPVHRGHIACARRIADVLELPRVLFIPTGNPNFKQDAHVTPAAMRVDMLRLALAEAGDARFFVDTREVERGGVTYSVDTLEELAGESGGRKPRFIMGADAAATLPHWKNAARIAELCHIVAVSRPGCDFAALRAALDACALPFTIEYVEAEMPDASSTQVRARVAAGLSVQDLVGVPVAAYIEEHGLYKGDAHAARESHG